MALESYILTTNVTTPIVRATGIPHKPQAIDMKRLRKGDIIKGELKHANNKPAFVLVDGVMVVPIGSVKKLVTKDIVSPANGQDESNVDGESKQKSTVIKTLPKVKYIDAIVVGALIGVGSVYLAEKQGWIPEVDKKNKLYGAILGAALGTYLLYRFKPQGTIKIKE